MTGRVLIGLVLFHIVLAAPGACFLYACGLMPSRSRSLVAAAGPSFLIGVVLCGLAVISVLALGRHVSPLGGLSLVAGVTAAVMIVGMRLRRNVEETAVEFPGMWSSRIELTLWAIGATAIACWMAFASLALVHAPTAWDDANIWSLRGLTLYEHGQLEPGLFKNADFSFVHLDYPLLQPVLEASFMRAIGGIDTTLWHVELWVVFAAALWTLGWLLAPYGRRWLWLVPLGIAASSPLVFGVVTLGDADVTMSALLACAVLSLGLWIDRGGAAHAVLGALFLGGAASVKNEGLAFAAAVLMAAAVVVFAGQQRHLRVWLVLVIGIVLICVAPWQVWVSGNEVATNQTVAPWRAIQHPSDLVNRLDFLWRGLEQTAHQLTTVASWQLLIPAFVVLAAGMYIETTRQAVTSFYLLAWLLGVLSVAYTYWVTPIFDLAGFEQRTGPRIVIGVAFIAVAAVAHLLQLTVQALEPPDTDLANNEVSNSANGGSGR